MMALLSFFYLVAGVAMALPTNNQGSAIPAGVPEFVVKYAPLVYLHSTDTYLPSDLATHLSHTTPKVNLDSLPAGTNLPQLTLANLDVLNQYGTNGTNIYLTANDDISQDPAWIKGIKPDANGVIANAKTGTIIVAEKDGGIVDAFYFYFYTFNWGGIVLGNNLGNHVGDWEHVMVRFINGVPKSVWYSQHSGGQAFNYDVVRKDKAGLRPLAFSGNGSHANYAIDGVHDHTAQLPVHGATPGILNDYTDYGPIFDLTQSAYWYKWSASVPQSTNTTSPASSSSPVSSTTSSPSSSPTSSSADLSSAVATPSSSAIPLIPREDSVNLMRRDVDPATTDPGTFTPYDPADPVGYLYYKGKWGDQRYAANDKRQKNFLGIANKYEGGPTGPAWKDIARKNVWPGKDGVIFPVLLP